MPESIDAPVFDVTAYRYLRDACDEDWREINPDIFGSMIQSVADPKQRIELGMHYTSVPNIMKVIGPLFLDDLDAEIDKAWERPNGLRKVLTRIEGIRVFDPACGSGNFLVVSYRQLRDSRDADPETAGGVDGGEHQGDVLGRKNRQFPRDRDHRFCGRDCQSWHCSSPNTRRTLCSKRSFGQGPVSLPLRESAHNRQRQRPAVWIGKMSAHLLWKGKRFS